MDLGVASPGRGVAGRGPSEAVGRCPHLRPSPPPALLLYDLVQVGHRGVALGVEDQVHVLGPADHAQLGYRLVRGYDQLHARPQAVHEPLAAVGVAGAPGAEDRPPLVEVNFAIQAERGGAGPAPHHGCLTSGGVVVERVADRVVPALEDGVLVVADRLGAHHPHPSQTRYHPSQNRLHAHLTTEGCNRVLLLSFIPVLPKGARRFLGDQ